MHNVNPTCRIWLLGILAFCGQQSLAAEGVASADADNVTIGQLEAIQSRNFLLEQQVQTARLTRQLRESQNESPAGPTAGTTPVVPFIPSNPLPPSGGQGTANGGAHKNAPAAVRLQEIYGRGAQLRARIILPQGGVTEVSAGDPLPGSSLSVKSVTLNAVKLSDGTELSF